MELLRLLLLLLLLAFVLPTYFSSLLKLFQASPDSNRSSEEESLEVAGSRFIQAGRLMSSNPTKSVKAVKGKK